MNDFLQQDTNAANSSRKQLSQFQNQQTPNSLFSSQQGHSNVFPMVEDDRNWVDWGYGHPWNDPSCVNPMGPNLPSYDHLVYPNQQCHPQVVPFFDQSENVPHCSKNSNTQPTAIPHNILNILNN